MLTYSIENRGGKSLYEYFYDCIRKDIVSGALKPGERLPSKRAFAKQNGVSVITVENAYGQLLAEGYLCSRPRSGFYVANIQDRMRGSGDGCALDTRSDEDGSVRFDLGARAMPAESFPFATWTMAVTSPAIHTVAMASSRDRAALASVS